MTSSLIAAVTWFADLLTGSIGTVVAILAVAAVGLLMLSGRIPVRRGVGVVIGCFVLFSASVIAEGLIAAARPTVIAVAPPMAPMTIYTPTVPRAVPYDPYAGASVPSKRSEQPGGIIR